MEIAHYKHHITIIGLIVLLAVLLAVSGKAPVGEIPAIRLELPETVGDYKAMDMMFCQNEQCLKKFAVADLTDTNICPACGGKLDKISVGEKKVLPADTVIRKKQYVNPLGQTIFVSIVLSGKEQKSIHRPQQCLPAQGYVIEKSKTISIPIDRHDFLKVMLLDLRKTGRTLKGEQYQYLSVYAYWFVGTDRETPYHLQRLFWMSTDRIIRGIAHRWAYISVATDRRQGSDEHIQRIKDFIAQLYPMIRVQKSEVGNQMSEVRNKTSDMPSY